MSNTCRESINNNEAQDGRRDETGKTEAAELRALGGEAEHGRAGVQQDDNVRSLIDATVDRFGRIGIAVNSAGVEGAPVASGFWTAPIHLVERTISRG